MFERFCKQSATLIDISGRYWELDKEHREIHRLWERLRLEWHQSNTEEIDKVIKKCIDELERIDIRISRQMDKYIAWMDSLHYWINLYNSAYQRLKQ